CCSVHPPALHSFPTRRSSDLVERQVALADLVKVSDEDVYWLYEQDPATGSADLLVEVGRSWLRRGPSLITITCGGDQTLVLVRGDRKSTRLNSSHVKISYAVF